MLNPGKIGILLTYGGGWATDFGPSFPGSPQGGVLTVPFLPTADNLRYELDGAPRKFGGSVRLNAAQVKEGSVNSTFEGLYDYWTQGTGGSETQTRVAVAGTQILKDDGDGVWDVIGSGFTAGAQPSFETFNDRLIVTTDSTAHTPQIYTQTGNVANLGGSPPNFSIVVKHKNRVWAAGVASKPSRLYYSGNLDEADWTGSTSGSIDIDPSDGDRITGLAAHKNDLFVFKGPNTLSIHRISGSSPTGSDAFARIPFVTGVGSVNHNGIFRRGDDIFFPSPKGLHSLATTAAYGDYEESFLSYPFHSFYQETLNPSTLSKCWGVDYQGRSTAMWLFAKGGVAKNVALLYDYRFKPGRWSTLGKDSAYASMNCLAVMQNAVRRHVLMAGGTDGFVRVLDMNARSIDTATAYTMTVEYPYLNLGSSAYVKSIEDGWLTLQPKGAYNITLKYQYDTLAATSVTISQAGGNVLG